MFTNGLLVSCYSLLVIVQSCNSDGLVFLCAKLSKVSNDHHKMKTMLGSIRNRPDWDKGRKSHLYTVFSHTEVIVLYSWTHFIQVIIQFVYIRISVCNSCVNVFYALLLSNYSQLQLIY